MEPQLYTQKLIDEGLSYASYVALMEKLVNEKQTTGSKQLPDRIEFTRLNFHRMKRLDKTIAITRELEAITRQTNSRLTWLVLTESWCGDAAQCVPVMAKTADVSSHIDLKILLRDEHPDIMDTHLTNGGKSIPYLICLDHNLQEIGSWGPRPLPAQQLLYDYKNNKFESYKAFQLVLHGWYANDKSITIQEEFIKLISKWQGITK